jgi:sugar lactone lactonase YvrE
MIRRRSIILLMCLAGTAALAQQHAKEKLVWPYPPEKPRIEFLYSFSSKQDIGIQKSWFRKTIDFLFGEERDESFLVRPQSIAVDHQGRIYVSDIAVKGVHVFDFERKEYKILNGSEDQRFVSPLGIAVADDGRVYVADSELGKIFVFDKEGTLRSSIAGMLKRPTGLWLSNGLLYIIDTGTNELVAIGLDGREQYRTGKRGTGDGEYNYPVYLCSTNLKSDGERLVVNDALNFRVQILRADGSYISKFGKLGDRVGHFARPKGIAIDSDAHIYVGDALFDVIQVFDQQGQILLSFGGSGTKPGTFSLPAGMCFDSKDRLYVVDSGNRRVQVFQYLK